MPQPLSLCLSPDCLDVCSSLMHVSPNHAIRPSCNIIWMLIMCHAQGLCATVHGVRARQGARPRGPPPGAEDPGVLLATHGRLPRRTGVPCAASQHPTEPVRGPQRTARLHVPRGETILMLWFIRAVQHIWKCCARVPILTMSISTLLPVRRRHSPCCPVPRTCPARSWPTPTT